MTPSTLRDSVKQVPDRRELMFQGLVGGYVVTFQHFQANDLEIASHLDHFFKRRLSRSTGTPHGFGKIQELLDSAFDHIYTINVTSGGRVRG